MVECSSCKIIAGKLPSNKIYENEKVLALDLFKREKIEIPKEIEELLQRIKDARESKKWTISDEIRNLIRDKGYKILDTPEGQKLEKVDKT
jgi:cysteinyl-tRNA synthetase